MLLITIFAKFSVLTSGKKLWVKLITKIHNSPTKDFFGYQKIMRFKMNSSDCYSRQVVVQLDI